MELEEATGVTLHLTEAEALVLFEWLASNEGTGSVAPDECERTVLLGLLADLEKQLVAPFRADYDELLERAHKEVRGPQD